MTERDQRKNAEGYADPTAYEAIRNVDKDDERFHRLLHTIFYICELAGFQIEGRVVLVDKRKGKGMEVINMLYWIVLVATVICISAVIVMKVKGFDFDDHLGVMMIAGGVIAALVITSIIMTCIDYSSNHNSANYAPGRRNS